MNRQKVAVLADSGCDVPPEYREKYDIRILPLRVMYPEKDYEDGVDIDPAMVYERFPDEFPTTSTPSLAEVLDVFEQIRKDGYEKVIAVTISGRLSGTFNTVRLAAEEEEDLDIFLFDSRNISVGAGVWAIWAASKLDKGWSFDEVKAGLRSKIADSKVMFYMDTLAYLKRGGRIGKVTSAVGEALHLKPIISCNEDGIYYTVGVIRGARQAKKKLLSEMLGFCGNHHAWIIIGHGNAPEEAVRMREMAQAQVRDGEILFVRQITATMAINTGPGLIGIGALLDP